MRTLYAVRDLGSAGRLTRLPITTLMHRPVPTVPSDADVSDAMAMMVRHHARHLAVVDPRGMCVGVLDQQAVSASWAASGPGRSVRSLLDSKTAIVTENAVVAQAARLLRATGGTAVAVADHHGLPVGIVTVADLIALLARDADQQHVPDTR